MSKKIPDDVMDVALNDIADNGNKLDLCSQEPASYAEIATYSLGQVTLTPGDGNGDYSVQDGDVSGRKLTLAEQTVPGSADGTATHEVISDPDNSAIKAITTCNIPVSNAVNVLLNEHDIWEIRDPS
jgi:hypothetical protein